jgi:hypothetical protein
MVNHEPAAVPFDENIRGRKQGVNDLAVRKPGFWVSTPTTTALSASCRIDGSGMLTENLGEAIE